MTLPRVRILAIDLGKFKSVACDFDSGTDDHGFLKLPTRPQDFHDLIVERSPDRVVIEVGSQAGWIQDMCQALEVPIQIANPIHDAWRWKSIKRKTDRDDALKLARLSAAQQLPTVTLPSAKVRQWRALIAYRTRLIKRRTAIKNNIRALLDRQGRAMPQGHYAWTGQALDRLRELARPLEAVTTEELWRGQLHLELETLDQVKAMVKQIETKLDAIAVADDRVDQLRSIPGVGPRLAEALVAMIDDPKRFKNRKQVGAYLGLVPRQFESGMMSRQGRITGKGNRVLRSLLVEVGWLMRRYNPHMKAIFDKTCRGSKTRRKIAVVATARRLLVIAWAMLRDGTRWQPLSAPALMT